MRTPAQWTTAAHLTMERRVLDRMDRLIDRHVDGLDAEQVERAIGSGPVGLAGDQADAVRLLCAPGPALRSLIAPAGFGKTTAVHAAAVAASSVRDAGVGGGDHEPGGGRAARCRGPGHHDRPAGVADRGTSPRSRHGAHFG